MSRPSAFDASSEWMTASAAKAVIGCASQAALMRLVILGRIRVQNAPGVAPRYHRGDVHDVAQARHADAGRLQPAGA